MFPNKRGLKSKLERLLSRQQREQLFTWLVKSEWTYNQAIAQMKKEWGVNASLSNLHGFYHGFCAPRIQRDSKPNAVLLDVILKRRANGSIQITILNHAPGTALFSHKNLKALIRRERE